MWVAHVDAVQPAVELGIAQARRPGVLRCRRPVAIVDVFEVGRGPPALQPLGGAIAGEQQLQQFGLGADEHVAARHAFDANASAVEQHERFESRARRHRHFQREPAADALADDMNAVEFQRVEKVEIEQREVR